MSNIEIVSLVQSTKGLKIVPRWHSQQSSLFLSQALPSQHLHLLCDSKRRNCKIKRGFDQEVTHIPSLYIALAMSSYVVLPSCKKVGKHTPHIPISPWKNEKPIIIDIYHKVNCVLCQMATKLSNINYCINHFFSY